MQIIDTCWVDAASQCRPVDSDYARSHTIKFNDLYPFLMISQVSREQDMVCG